MGYTPEQEDCITTFAGPIDVSAGAGSGKTFTLTQRIAHALESPVSGVDDIDQVLAITFTKKAAAELKGRVRSTLQASGMFNQARKVDSAWISTIHGMCSRILRSCALEMGIDPGFIAVENSDTILNEAIEEVLEESRENAYQNYRLLFSTYAAQPAASSQSSSGESVAGLLGALLEEVYALPHGFESMRFIASGENPTTFVRQLVCVYEEGVALMHEVNASATQENNISGCTQAKDMLLALLGAEPPASEPPSAGEAGTQPAASTTAAPPAPAPAPESLTPRIPAIVAACFRISAGCGSPSQKEAIKALQVRFDEAIMQLLACYAAEVCNQLVALAREVDKRFTAKKRARSVLDFSDLVRLTLQALENPHIRAQYENKFRLVMVDEFQDTDALQLAIVSKLSGEGLRYLCTVGDAQQSIYRFRGADVALYRSYQENMFSSSITSAGGTPRALALTTNFRSHGDILAFVKKVCAQQSVFGHQFLDLHAHYNGAGYRASFPRIYMDVTLRHKGKNAEVGSADDACVEQGKRIAAYFARMHAAGHSLSQMVLLLGQTTNAATYARVLREAGFDCVISGGSLFAKSEEARTLVNVCQALVCEHDTRALLNTLAGPLFQLNSSELLSLATYYHPSLHTYVTCTLDNGMQHCLENPANYSPAVVHAVTTLRAAHEHVRTRPLSHVVLRLLWQTGVFARLETRGAQGSASIGNYAKALRLIQHIEEENACGPVYACMCYKHMIQQGMKEAPGAINVHNQQAIRIMTIHASKGLEFPIVALADFVKKPHTSNMLIARVQGQAFATLFPRTLKIGSTVYNNSMQAGLVGEQPEPASAQALETAPALAAQVMLRQCAASDEAAEEQRLFYVGATRAKEALGIFVATQVANSAQSMYPGVCGQVVQALFSDGEVPVGESVVEYGGSEPARVVCRFFEPCAPAANTDALTATLGATTPAPEPAAAPAPAAPPAETSAQQERFWFDVSNIPLTPVAINTTVPETNIVSYSSLAERLDESTLSFAQLRRENGLIFSDKDDNNQAETYDSMRPLPADEDKATNFGSAFHRMCQLACVASPHVARENVHSLAKTYQIASRSRLLAAFERWQQSNACARAQKAQACFAEYPFAVKVGETGTTLEGVIDLLCVEQAHECAYVVDYKTGGNARETHQHLLKKHALQAYCYAYALLLEGFERVDIDFVRVEQPSLHNPANAQTISYCFTRENLEHIQTNIVSCLGVN